MTGESGRRIIQDGRIPVAPVYTRLGDVVAPSSASGAAVEPVPPYFAGAVATPEGLVSESALPVEAEVPVAVQFEAPEDQPVEQPEVVPAEIEATGPEETVVAEPFGAVAEPEAEGDPVTTESEPTADEWTEDTGTGLETAVTRAELSPTAPVSPAAYELAARLEAIAQRLRTDGTAAVVAGMRGDRLDALLAGVFAGYLAAHEVDS